jgi:hypothetical protein
MTTVMRAPQRRCLIVAIVAAILLAAPSGASVLCFGSDGHVAFEPSRDGIECFDVESPSSAAGASMLGGEDCVDQPIHAKMLTRESTRTTAFEAWSNAAPWLLPIAASRSEGAGAAARAPLPARVIRTVVLRL